MVDGQEISKHSHRRNLQRRGTLLKDQDHDGFWNGTIKNMFRDPSFRMDLADQCQQATRGLWLETDTDEGRQGINSGNQTSSQTILLDLVSQCVEEGWIDRIMAEQDYSLYDRKSLEEQIQHLARTRRKIYLVAGWMSSAPSSNTTIAWVATVSTYRELLVLFQAKQF